MEAARAGVVVVVLGLVMLLDAGAVAAQECTSKEAEKRLLECPAGVVPMSIQKRRRAAITVKPPDRTRKGKLSKPAPPAVAPESAVEIRKRKFGSRPKALLVSELQGLERLFSKTHRRAADRLKILKRLADGYAELAALESSTRTALEVQVSQKKIAGAKARRARKQASVARRTAKRARMQSISKYRRLIRDYGRTYSSIDEVLYNLAYEQEALGNPAAARRTYLQLIRTAPTSKYVPKAYLAFGELFFVQAQGDPSKWTLARDAYRKVLEYPPPANEAHSYARYKLAYVHWNLDELQLALAELKRVITGASRHPQQSGAAMLARSARRDLIPVYAAVATANEAHAFFRPLAGSDRKAVQMLGELALAYLDTGRYAEAIAMFRDLQKRDPGSRECHYQAQVVHATAAMKSSNKMAIARELESLLSLRGRYVRASHSKKEKRACSGATAELITETAMAWHLEAIGTDDVRGTGDAKAMALASKLYEKIESNFTDEGFLAAKFARIVKEDRPTLCSVRYASADLLYEQQKWAGCGRAFDSVVEKCGHTRVAAEAAYAAVQCYKKLYDAEHARGEDRRSAGLMDAAPPAAKLAPVPLSARQTAMIGAFDRYLCFIEPDEKDKAAIERYVDVKYARARTYFETQHWEEALVGFRDIALAHANHGDAAVYAAHLYLESANVLASRFERGGCLDQMAADVPKFSNLFCANSSENVGECRLFGRIDVDLQRRAAEALVTRADHGAANARDLYKSAGEKFLKLWQRCKMDESCENGDELLYNSAKAFQAGHYLAKSIQVRRILVEQYETAPAKKALHELGENHQAIAVYDQAAKYFEQYAKVTKYRGAHAAMALSDAVVLRLGLGQTDEAIANAAAFRKHLGARKPVEASQIAVAIASHHADTRDFSETRRWIAAALRLIDKSAPLDLRVQAHTLLGRASAKLGRRADATRAYQKVLELWADPKASVRAIETTGEPSRRSRRLGRALDAVGEALFHAAEQERLAAEQVRFPEYRGPKTRSAMLAHVNGPVKKWMQKKRPLIVAASKSYKRIVDLEPTAPPKWVIAAGARVGTLWGDYVQSFRDAPVPPEIRGDQHLYGLYIDALIRASERERLAAKGAYETCLAYAVKYQYFDGHSRACEEWLATNYKAEYHTVDEFRGAPSRTNSTLAERARPVNIGGATFTNR